MKFTTNLRVKDKDIQKAFPALVQKLADRLAVGEKQYGRSTYKKMDLKKEIQEEVMDMLMYGMFQDIVSEKMREPYIAMNLQPAKYHVTFVKCGTRKQK